MTSDRSPVGVRHLTVVPENFDGEGTDPDERRDRTRRGDRPAHRSGAD